MLVETFEVLEASSTGTPECDAESIQLIEKLDLTAQKVFTAKPESGVATRVPYRLMTDDELFVYGTLLEVNPAERYNSGPIPLRVLQVMAHAKELGVFTQFHIWHEKDSTVKDPILTATMGDRWDPKHYLLARWGEQLESLETLMEQAAKRYLADKTAEIVGKLDESERRISSLRQLQTMKLSGRALWQAAQKIVSRYY